MMLAFAAPLLAIERTHATSVSDKTIHSFPSANSSISSLDSLLKETKIVEHFSLSLSHSMISSGCTPSVRSNARTRGIGQKRESIRVREKGEAAIAAIITANRELNEYNSSGSYMVYKVWNFEEERAATGAEYRKSVVTVAKVKVCSYDERLWYKALHAHLKLDNISTLLALLGDIGSEVMARLIFRAVVEGKDNGLEVIKRYKILDQAKLAGWFEAMDDDIFNEFHPAWSAESSSSMNIPVVQFLTFSATVIALALYTFDRPGNKFLFPEIYLR
ncbi:hypothetical protein RND71_015016 [Anisodus tanguticus]|uniref:Factor of DNA methylation 1-5/IDN2 domain-containing protein n=1 Tax=Anisodus tanguticus TaxID=243964 RepID=A0AAE1VKE2_9SOLA|nr:hypothetical protein RND71_015016 [Anisodus tanguticus]